MATTEIERALAAGAARSRAALTPMHAGSTPQGGAVVPRAHGAWLVVRVRDLWARRKWWIIGAGLFLLLDLVAGFAASASGGHL